MDSFIHTFCITTKISTDELSRLKSAYDELFWNGDTKKHVLGKYADCGLRIEIENCKKEEIKLSLFTESMIFYVENLKELKNSPTINK